MPRLTVPSSSGVLSTTFAPSALIPTLPPKELLEFVNETAPSGELMLALPPNNNGPVWTTPPASGRLVKGLIRPVLTAVRSLAGSVSVKVPKSSTLPAVALTSPEPVIVMRPRSVAPALVVVNEPPTVAVPISRSPP